MVTISYITVKTCIFKPFSLEHFCNVGYYRDIKYTSGIGQCTQNIPLLYRMQYKDQIKMKLNIFYEHSN